jgi:site-specific DNA-cytosine methylase
VTGVALSRKDALRVAKEAMFNAERERLGQMKILVACEFSGVVRDAFAAKGHDVWSFDLLPSERPGNHIQDDVRTTLDHGWDMMIAFPPCTHLAVSGARWFKEKRQEQEEALEFVRCLLGAPIPMIALENPVGIISTRIRKPDQIIQPWQFGHETTKTTCLWLKSLPHLVPTEIVDKGERRYYASGKSSPMWHANTGGGCGHERSRTFTGIAKAMADQWG